MTRTLLGLMGAALLFAFPAQSAIYFVSTAGSDSNPGSLNAPVRHLSKGAALAKNPGDTVIVMDGTYDNEGVIATPSGGGSVVNLAYSGLPGKPITFRASHRGKAILDAMNTSSTYCNGAWAYFDLKNASYIVIQGFVIQRGCYNGIRSNANAHDVTIKWNEIRNIGNWANPGGTSSPSGIYLNSGEYDFTFDGNEFHDIGLSTPNQEHAIYTSASNLNILNNVFYNQLHGYDIQVAGGTNILIANNTFAFPNPNRPGQVILWDDGVPGAIMNITIRNNLFYQPTNFAIVTDLIAPISGSCAIDHDMTTSASLFDNGSPCSLASNYTNANPMLTNTSSTPYDFSLQSGSPAIGAGVSVSNAPNDFNGAPRATGSTCDLGAYAYLPANILPIASILNGATLQPTSIAPGEIVTITGSGLGPPGGANLSLDCSGLVSTILGGTRVLFDGTPAPIIYASDGVVNAIVPFGVDGESATEVALEYNGAQTPTVSFPVVNAAPGIFTVNASGSGQGSILNQNLSLNSVSNPAPQGSVIVIYGTGVGQTSPTGVDGYIITSLPPPPVLPVSVTIGGQPAQVTYAGSAPGLVFGVLQVDAVVPGGLPSGTQVSVIVTVGTNSSPTGVTVALP